MKCESSWLNATPASVILSALLACTTALSPSKALADEVQRGNDAQLLLFNKGAELYKNGNQAAGLELFRQTGTNGLLRAQSTLAEILFERRDEPSRTEAIRWALLAARQGEPVMRKRLIIELRAGDAGALFVECWPWLTILAQSGEPWLKFQAGIWAFNGFGGQRRMEIAFSYFSAANQDESFRRQAPQSSFLLGYLLENGFGTAQNYSAAAELYWQAAELGWPEAVYRLGLLAEHGQGISTDRETARLLYVQAADLGIAQAAYRLGLLALGQASNTQGRTTAFNRFLQAATNGLSVAQAKVALSYEQDWALKGSDVLEAIAWYKIAADSGNRSARIRGDKLQENLSRQQQEAFAGLLSQLKAKVATGTTKAWPGRNLLPEAVLAKRSELLQSGVGTHNRPRRLAEARLTIDPATNNSANSGRNNLEAGTLKIYLDEIQNQVRQLVSARLADLSQKGIGKSTISVEEPEIILCYRLLSDGRVEDVEVIDTNLDDVMAGIFMGALQDSSPSPRWTPSLRSQLSEEFQDLLLAFGKKSVLMISQ